ncbi:MAG: glk [Ilumatobacteraceae bacterium]|nr:glk [Ilumatobacteraceae bacterium]
MTRAAGIDVGGTKFLGVVLDDAGEIVVTKRRPTPAGGDAVVRELAEFARELGDYDTLGVGVPGLVTRDGVLRAAPNLVGADEVAVGARLTALLGHPVAVDNDATCAMVAEWLHGAARGFDDVVLVTLGTGIGGGLVMGGRLQRGANGFAGEFGHVVVEPNGIACVCGRRGCWERYASGSGLAMLAGGRTGEDVVAAAEAGDRESLAVIDLFAHWVALGLANLTNVLDPACIVLGGGLAAAPGVFLGPIEREFVALLYSSENRPRPQLAFAALGERAGAIGAALLPSLPDL